MNKVLGLLNLFSPPAPLEPPRPVYITRETYLGPEKYEDLAQHLQDNCDDLLLRVNEFLYEFDQWMLINHPEISWRPGCNSGKRSIESNAAIYARINAARIARQQQPVPVATKSTHIDANGIDLSDPYDLIKEFIKASKQLMDRLDLFYELFEFTDTWVHLQRIAFNSFNGSTRGYRPY